MASTKYTYSVANDTLNAKLDGSALKKEIQDSAIVTALDFINISGDVLDVWTKDALSTGDETLLDGIVADHIGDPVVEPPQIVIVSEEEFGKETGGHYQIQSFEIEPTADTGWFTKEISFPFPIALLSASWVCKTENEGDEVQLLVGENTVVGAIGADVAVDDVVIKVSTSTYKNLKVGGHMSITDGTNTDDLGHITAMDVASKEITVQTAATHAFSASTPTYVRITTDLSPHIHLTGNNVPMSAGESKIGASSIPANIVIKAKYNNISATAKKFSFLFEYLY